jgi:hypothetical protein
MFVPLHAFGKRTAPFGKRTAPQTPERDIAVAEGRMQRYLRTEGGPT